MSDRTPQDPSPPGEPGPAPPPDDADARHREMADALRSRAESFALATAAREAAVEAAKKAGRFSREFVITVISVVSTALGVVVALAWNSALSAGLTEWFGVDGRVAALFVYAFLITFLAVVFIVIMSRVARRIDATPLEFKIEGKKE